MPEPFDFEAALDAARKFKLLCKAEQRNLGKLAEIPCAACGRRPTVLTGGRLAICPCLMAAIEQHSQAMPCGASRLAAIPLVVFDDGPARF